MSKCEGCGKEFEGADITALYIGAVDLDTPLCSDCIRELLDQHSAPETPKNKAKKMTILNQEDRQSVWQAGYVAFPHENQCPYPPSNGSSGVNAVGESPRQIWYAGFYQARTDVRLEKFQNKYGKI